MRLLDVLDSAGIGTASHQIGLMPAPKGARCLPVPQCVASLQKRLHSSAHKLQPAPRLGGSRSCPAAGKGDAQLASKQ
jgi:hypothetical protein